MKIVPNQVFLHGRERYEPGVAYKVSDPRGQYFIECGWATEVDGPVTRVKKRWFGKVRSRG